MPTTDCRVLEVMTFRVGGHEFGLDINDIQEINCHAILRYAPVSYPSVAGVINLRGEVLTVVALGRLLGISNTIPYARPGKYIVLDNSDERLALLVDEVADVETLSTHSLLPLPANFSIPNSQIFEGLIQKPKGLLLILNASELPWLGLENR